MVRKLRFGLEPDGPTVAMLRSGINFQAVEVDFAVDSDRLTVFRRKYDFQDDAHRYSRDQGTSSSDRRVLQQSRDRGSTISSQTITSCNDEIDRYDLTSFDAFRQIVTASELTRICNTALRNTAVESETVADEDLRLPLMISARSNPWESSRSCKVETYRKSAESYSVLRNSHRTILLGLL